MSRDTPGGSARPRAEAMLSAALEPAAQDGGGAHAHSIVPAVGDPGLPCSHGAQGSVCVFQDFLTHEAGMTPCLPL